ncbi:MAG: hypothetical protein K9N52_03205 [Verrucomicrobia bacterium]|nr:hypothetical protein [Verrucomicrobiota bacterium]
MDTPFFTIRGNAFYHDLGRFIADFENTFRFMRIENLSITPGGGTETSSQGERLSFTMDIAALVKPVPTTAPAGTTE